MILFTLQNFGLVIHTRYNGNLDAWKWWHQTLHRIRTCNIHSLIYFMKWRWTLLQFSSLPQNNFVVIGWTVKQTTSLPKGHNDKYIYIITGHLDLHFICTIRWLGKTLTTPYISWHAGSGYPLCVMYVDEVTWAVCEYSKLPCMASTLMKISPTGRHHNSRLQWIRCNNTFPYNIMYNTQFIESLNFAIWNVPINFFWEQK